MKHFFCNRLVRGSLWLLASALVFAVIAISMVTSSTYTHYTAQYNSCLSEYESHLSAAGAAANAADRETYHGLANHFSALAQTWQGRVGVLQTRATTCGICSGACFFGAVVLLVIALIKQRRAVTRDGFTDVATVTLDPNKK